jgi:polyisoprenoid-binding protein YceI
VTGQITQTRFDIQIPVNDLTIDEPAMREQAGADFPPGVPQSARDGTRRNLLSPALLDGANYPTIRLRATDVATAGDAFDVGVEITLKDQVRSVRVPVSLERKDGALKATGEFPLKQSELGFKPFSVAMGSLVVLDEMRIRFEVVARAPVP